jgi:hypothetical protein
MLTTTLFMLKFSYYIFNMQMLLNGACGAFVIVSFG